MTMSDPPKAPTPVEPDPSLDAADDDLVRGFDLAMEEARLRAGPLFGCGPGRRDCCRGPFPINLLDARRLQRGMTALASRNPARARAVRHRAAKSVRRLARRFPGDPRTGRLDADEKTERDFCTRHGALMCPALEPATGLCDLYEWRPLACRSMGPPVRLGGVDLAPCPHCFGPASAEDIARCRAAPDPEGREDALLADLEAREGRRGDTLIAFALLGSPTTRA
jgi:Fe-S-cluster containining protein